MRRVRVDLTDGRDPVGALAALDPGAVDLVVRPEQVPEALAAARDRHPRVRAEGWTVSATDLAAWVDLGLEALQVVLDGPDTPSEALARAASSVDHLRLDLELPLSADLVAHAGWAAALAGDGAARLDLRPGEPPAPREAVLVAVDEALREASRRGVPLRAHALGVPPDPPDPTRADAPGVSPQLLDVVRGAVPLPALVDGCRWDGDPDGATEKAGGVARLGGVLGAIGWPVHELSRCQGGLGRRVGEGRRCGRCPGGEACHGAPDDTPSPVAPAAWTGVGRDATIHVIAPFLGDRIQVQSSLPGLARALEALGADVTLHSAWDAPFNPHGDPPTSALGPLADEERARHEHAERHVVPFLRSLDLGDADAIVVPGLNYGEALWRLGVVPSWARLIVTDDHLMFGIDSWKKRHLPAGARSWTTDWWPSERIHVHSCFPGYARLYWYAGIPPGQTVWRPYPTCAAHFSPREEGVDGEAIFSGGAHLRDHDTLFEALRRAGDGSPLHLYAPSRPAGAPSRVDYRGRVPLPAFFEAIARSRFVVVPVHHVPDKAAGLSVVALALAAGRPVVATATPGTLDHVEHGVSGLLVPAGDPDALAEAIRRVDGDDGLRARLAAGARAAGARADVAAWARTVTDGASPAPVADPRTGGAPWRPWR